VAQARAHGLQARLYDDIFAGARPGDASELLFSGHVPDDDLVDLYKPADLFVYPSSSRGSAYRPWKPWLAARPPSSPTPPLSPRFSTTPL
jgi:glycosyltransferase involved in cell wall biosynthesis